MSVDRLYIYTVYCPFAKSNIGVLYRKVWNSDSLVGAFFLVKVVWYATQAIFVHAQMLQPVTA